MMKRALPWIIFSLFLTACGSGTTGTHPAAGNNNDNGNGSGNPTPTPGASSNWDEMKWDEGKWK